MSDAITIEKALLDCRVVVEDLLQSIINAQNFIGRRGVKAKLREVRSRAMDTRHNLKDLRVSIIEELKKKD